MESMEEKRVIYDKVAINIRALSILIVFGIFMTILVMGYGYFLGNSGSGAIPAGADREEEKNDVTEVFRERENTPILQEQTENFGNGDE